MKIIDHENYYKKIMGCFLGKSVGGTLGGPYEGNPGPLDLEYYDPVPQEMLPNDDLDLQVVWLENIIRRGFPINRFSLAETWLENIHMWPDEYGIADRNLSQGIYPPASGSFDNKFTAGMGAAIRTELWACLAPNEPELAVRLAREDACVDHDEEGIYAAMFLAALESMAFAESDIHKLIDEALIYIPKKSRVGMAVQDTREWWDVDKDWMSVRKKIIGKYLIHNWTDVSPNLAVIILGLLAGEGDFSRSICTAVNCGLDTDCTGATLGALLGILDPDSIGDRWLKPIGKKLVLSPGMVGMHHVKDLDHFCRQIAALAAKVGEYYKLDTVIDGVEHISDEKISFEYDITVEHELIELGTEYSSKGSLIATTPLIVNIRYTDSVVFFPGKSQSIQVEITNPSDSTVEGGLTVNVPVGWKIDDNAHVLKLDPLEKCSLELKITSPSNDSIRIYRNMLDLNFEINCMRWSCSAGMIQSTPWLRYTAEQAGDPSMIPDDGKFEVMEAAGHFQEVPEGNYVYFTDIKVPYNANIQFVTQGTRKMKLWLDDKLINEYDGSYYVPAIHRNQTGVNIDCTRGWHRVAIAVDDGPEGEMFFGFGDPGSWKWITDMEFRLPCKET